MTRAELLEIIEQAERGPSPGDLEGAPLLSNWLLHSRDGLIVAEGTPEKLVADGADRGAKNLEDVFLTCMEANR